jgi:hypothetical protein
MSEPESQNNRKYISGAYTPKNPEKYKGKGLPYYKSSYEWRVMYWCDLNTNVIEWSYEPFPIEYTFQVPSDSPQWMKNLVDYRTHKYYVDFYAKVLDNNGKAQNFMLEIKPANQTVAPKEPKRKTKKSLEKFMTEMKEYIKNCNKWNAADTFFNKRGYKFQVLTEQDLFT